MTEIKTATQNKLAMSRALGAAFLNHQVEQLERTVNNTGPTGGNWRDRKLSPSRQADFVPRGASGKRPPFNPAAGKPPRRKGGEAPERNAQDTGIKAGRRSPENAKKEKIADVIVIDASVLIHCIGQVKVWCREGREEVLIIPLEALNTLDLLKKGTSALAQRARTASRILEAQVGTNNRVRVQSDDAFVPWDNISFAEDGAAVAHSPEWVRRTICCARWEVDNEKKIEGGKTERAKVVLAILSQAAPPPNLHSPKPSDGAAETASPVPLPVPQVHANKHEPRSSGALVTAWARRAGIELLELRPLPAQEDEDRANGRRGPTGQYGRPPRRGGPGDNEHRRPSVSNGSGGGGGNKPNVGLVERPPAVKAMMDIVAQPSKVVRVLARGEKLDPDT
ncbi:hypothetical protein PUNSTDRAFT_108195 [Punctularia strigosozonata HHB-11173 SS5]|uniref:PIN domain-containing protein n=1 Tax=Punctularia strigosozonata (strain HHB-11173) TaxID=741275 RepID=R7S2K5_PUNST|nr:uncharacterized protein PUNSTDRAFT_108195 [Punctularia strigosozonata HHB-11173 SS5]EIN04443.1 hypothetical protein PUNSTDRAFT_108195 [Punctularia strigosozonata HHB-11173 SS5]